MEFITNYYQMGSKCCGAKMREDGLCSKCKEHSDEETEEEIIERVLEEQGFTPKKEYND